MTLELAVRVCGGLIALILAVPLASSPLTILAAAPPAEAAAAFAAEESISTAATGIAVDVLDKNGATISGLGPADFAVKLDGKVVEVSEVEAGPPLSVVLLVDVSLQAIPFQDEIRRGADRFAASLDEDDEMEIIVFGGSTARLFPFSSDHLEMRRKILSYSFQAVAGEPSKLHDGLVRAIESVQTRSGRRAVVTFTQGFDERSSQPFTAALEAAREGNVRLEFFHLRRPRKMSGNYWRQLLARLEKMARETGGQLHLLKELSEAESLYESMAHKLTGSYRLVIAEAAGDSTGLPHRVQVRLRTKGARVFAPTGYSR